jgi:nucleoside-diphosphate-sugar epimerase
MAADTVLVTGGAGYVGSHLTRKLLARGHRVRVLDNFLYGDRGLADVRHHAQLEIRYGDICNPHDVHDAVRGCRAVVALAALVGDAACEIDPEEAVAINFRSSRLLVEACRQKAVERLVFASSCSVYGASGNCVLTEDSHLNPVSLYARTRIMSEEVLAQERGGVDIVILRLATVCGLSHRMRFDLMVNTITAHAVIDGRIKIVGPSQWRPHVHVQDAAEAFTRAVEAERRPGVGVYNVGDNSQNFTIGEIATKVTEALPGTSVETSDGSHDRRSYRVSFDRIANDLGFGATFRVEDAIREVAELLQGGGIPDYNSAVYHNVKYLRANGVRRAAV